MRSPVMLAWAGLGAMVATIVLAAAVRDPVFAGAEAIAQSGGKVSGLGPPGVPGEGAAAADGSAAGGKAGGKGDGAKAGGKRGAGDTEGGIGEGKGTPSVLPGVDVRGLQAEFEGRVRRNDLKGALSSLEMLVAADKNALKESSTKEQVIELSQRVMLLPGDEPDRMFDVLASKSGTTGIDILYYLVTAKGSSRAAKAAEKLLAQDEIAQRGSDAMQAAWALRRASCQDKRKHFARAGEVGDVRSLGQLQILKTCRRRSPCCYEKDADLEAALAAFKARGIAQ